VQFRDNDIFALSRASSIIAGKPSGVRIQHENRGRLTTTDLTGPHAWQTNPWISQSTRVGWGSTSVILILAPQIWHAPSFSVRVELINTCIPTPEHA
jgi:hypothetical protein